MRASHVHCCWCDSIRIFIFSTCAAYNLWHIHCHCRLSIWRPSFCTLLSFPLNTIVNYNLEPYEMLTIYANVGRVITDRIFAHFFFALLVRLRNPITLGTLRISLVSFSFFAHISICFKLSIEYVGISWRNIFDNLHIKHLLIQKYWNGFDHE